MPEHAQYAQARHARLFELLNDQRNVALISARLKQRPEYVDEPTARHVKQLCVRSLRQMKPSQKQVQPSRAALRPLWPQTAKI